MYNDDMIFFMIMAAMMGYFIGAVPFGLVLTKLIGLGDIRKIGSGNIGATNVLRTGNWKIAVLVLLLDGAKGAFAIGLTLWLGLSEWIRDDPAMLAGLCAILGHNFPIWLRFKGGKGVATTIGVLLALAWPVGLAVIALWLLSAFIWRYSSLAAMISLGLSPAIMWWVTNDPPAAYLAALLAFLSFLRHRENLTRLRNGKEGKIKFSSKP